MGMVPEGRYFEREKSSDGLRLAYLGRVAGNKQCTSYRYMDSEPFKDISFYGLNRGYSRQDQVCAGSYRIQAPAGDFQLPAYPNPARHLATVAVGGIAGNNPEVTVSGRVPVRMSLVQNETTINRAQWAGGVYLPRYTDALRTQTFKISKG